MTQYCSALEVKRRWSGDQPTMSTAQDGDIISAIVETTDAFDQEIRSLRGEGEGWSLLAARAYGVQVVSVSGIVQSGTFTLTFGAMTSAAIAATATAVAMQTALDSICGAGHTVVTGAPGGPWTVTFAGTLSGPQPVLVAVDGFTPATSGVLVEEMITGAIVPAARRYTGRGASLLLIDDALEIASVSLIRPDGTLVRVLTPGTDYLPFPINSLPIVGLIMVSGTWDTTPGGVLVVMGPGYCQDVPDNLHKACIDEVIRTIRGGQVGLDDRAGTAPYSAQTITRSWLSTTMRTLYRYRFGGGYLRGGQ